MSCAKGRRRPLAGSGGVAFDGKLPAGARRAETPSPAKKLGIVLAVFRNVLLVIKQGVANGLLGIGGARTELRQPVNYVLREVKTIQLVEHASVEGCRQRAFPLVAADVQIVVVGPEAGKLMDQPRVAMESEDRRLVSREEHVKILIVQPVRMLAWRLEFHQVHHVDDADL